MHGIGRPITDDEMLLRIVISPRDARDASPPEFNEPAVLSILRRGLSVLRERYATPNEIVELATQLARSAAENLPSSENASAIGVIRFPAGLARRQVFPAGLLHGGMRKYCVYETPEELFPSHADVLMAADRYPSGSQRRRAAFALYDELKPLFVPTSAFTTANLAGISYPGARQD